MLIALDSGVSALDQFQQELNIIGNNIANVDTVGYKGATIDFADAFSQTLGSNASGSMQIGTGVLTSAINNQFTQGSITGTGVQTDMAINGNGFFLVKDPVSGAQYVTRDGQFTVDTNGYLVTSNGMRVQGYSDAGLTTLGDVKIDNTGATMTDPVSGLPVADPSAVQNYSFASNGKLTVLLADGTQFTRGQVLLQNFTNPQQLMKVGNNLFSGLTAAGPLAVPMAPSSNGLGSLATSALEMSNVDLAGQLTSLITTQRAYEANTKVITTSDEILQDLVNLKR
jgi:flagellar hook protein FlgE